MPPEVAEEIGAALKRRCEIAGVFVNSPLEEVIEAAERENLTLLQFHGEEGPSFCVEARRRTGAKVIKAMRVTSAADVQAAEAFRTDFHLFDAYWHGIHGGTGKSFDWDLVAKRRSKVPMILAGGLTPENVADAIELVKPFAVDVVSGVEAEPGRKDHAKVEAFLEAAGVEVPSRAAIAMSTAVEERFGPYGGRFVPETLIAALDELSAAWAEAREDEGFQNELSTLLRDFVGRPTPLYLAERLSERVGRRVYLKREDLAHTGAHKINNAVGQALLARRMGKSRVIAETGAGQHGVATATACALFGLECAVYMGSEDIRRQAPNVDRMRLLGAEVIAVEAGARTLKEAVSAAIRDWVASVENTHYVIGSVVGPAPYPALVRDLQRVIGDEARSQALEVEGSLPERVIACVGGGSNAIGSFHAFLDDPVELIGVEAAGEGLESGRHGASLVAGTHRRAARRALLGARRRGGPDPRGALRLRRARLPGRRARARPAARLRPRAIRGGDRCRGAARVPRARPARGDHPRARARPRDRLAAREKGGGDGYDVLTLSGRGDKDMDEVTAKLAGLDG